MSNKGAKILSNKAGALLATFSKRRPLSAVFCCRSKRPILCDADSFHTSWSLSQNTLDIVLGYIGIKET